MIIKNRYVQLGKMCSIVPMALFLLACSEGTSDVVTNYGPLFSSANTHSVAENNTDTGYIATATDRDGDVLTFGISGGVDQALFSINASSGVLAFVSAPDFENPADADGNNDYVISLSVFDGDITNPLTLTVTVTDVVNESNSGVTVITLTKTGQGLCYDTAGTTISCTGTGQDGEIQAGAVLASVRFTDNGDGTLTDVMTGLIWPADGNIMPTRDAGWDMDGTVDDGVVTWQHALDYVAKLNAESYLGVSDWRLPNRNEIRSVAIYGETINTNMRSAQGFSNYGNSYWSSTSNDTVRSWAWSYNMSSGYVFLADKTELVAMLLHVVPVRGGSETAAAAIAKTGQTQCFNTVGTTISCTNTGQDGASQLGVSWPQARFTTNADSTIADNFTNLAWAADANLVVSRDIGWDMDGGDDGAVTWQHALDYIAKLNAESYLGHTNWRLPNVVELESLMNNGADMNTLLAAGGFSNLGANYWTSTSYNAIPSFAWAVHVGDGLLVANGGSNPSANKTSTFLIWPVHDQI